MVVLQLYFGVNIFEMGHCVLNSHFIDDVVTDGREVDFEKRALKVWESVKSIDMNSNSEVHFA